MIFISLVIITLDLPGQPIEIAAKEILKEAEKKSVPKYSFDQEYEYLSLGSAFSKETIQRIQYTDRRILKIDLVYTAYRESPEFSQEELNLARLKNLIDINPAIISNKFFDWQLIKQTGCYSSKQCKDFYHGFVIYYDKYYTKEDTRSEIDSIRQDLGALESTIIQNQPLLEFTTNQIDCAYPEMLYSDEYLTKELEKYYSCSEKYNGRVFFTARMDYKGRTTDVSIKGSLFPCQDQLAAALKYILQWKRGLVIGRKQYGLIAEGMIHFPLKKESVSISRFRIADSLVQKFKILEQTTRCTAYEVDTTYTRLIPKVTKKEVSSVLFRNQWNDPLIVIDVTGSMFPYTADLLKWIRLGALREEKTFVFFNDGNDKPTSQKKIGETGGLYLVRSQHFSEVRDKMFEAMRSGGGGDLRENNVEALLFGISKSGYPKTAIMIADNYAFPRDHQLLANYKGQLKIILCGTEKGINTDYMNLARKYRFTLHTLKEDITDLQNVNVGQRIKIDGFDYRMTSSGFERISLIR